MYQRIAFIIVVFSGAAILAYCAADDIFLSFAQKHWRHDMKCGREAPSPTNPTEEAICNPAGITYTYTWLKRFAREFGKSLIKSA